MYSVYCPLNAQSLWQCIPLHVAAAAHVLARVSFSFVHHVVFLTQSDTFSIK